MVAPMVPQMADEKEHQSVAMRVDWMGMKLAVVMVGLKGMKKD